MNQKDRKRLLYLENFRDRSQTNHCRVKTPPNRKVRNPTPIMKMALSPQRPLVAHQIKPTNVADQTIQRHSSQLNDLCKVQQLMTLLINCKGENPGY